MDDNFQNYYYENIIVPYYDYIEEKQEGSFGRSNDIKKAIVCASKLYHLREYLSPSPSCKAIVSLCSAYKIIQDVTNVSKHRVLTKGAPEVSNINQISELIVITTFEDEKGEFTDSDKVVQITKDNGITLFLHDILYNVICFWDKYLYDNKLINKEYKLKIPAPIGKVKQRSECKNVGIASVRGLGFKISWLMMKWDYAKNVAVPIDLTGAKMQFKVYKPKLTPQINMVDNKTGEVSNLDILLNEEDLIKFNLFETDSERFFFVKELDYAKEQIIKHFKEIDK